MSEQPESATETATETATGTAAEAGTSEAGTAEAGTDEVRPDTRTPEQIAAKELRKSPRRGLCAAVLALEAIALGLTTPVLITVADVPVALALVVGLGLCVLSILTAGMLRKEWGYWLGGAIQVAAFLIGFWIPQMFLLGGVFALCWFGADALGRKIEREKREAWTAWVEEQNAASA